MAANEEMNYLEKYNIEDYDRPSVTSDIVVFSIFEDENENRRKMAEGKLSILLIRRNVHPYKDSWALPGGFLRKDETMEQCAIRELCEETGLDNARLIQIGTFSKPGRDMRGWIISNAYLAPIYGENVKVRGGDDAAEAAWFELQVEYDDNKHIYSINLSSRDRDDEVRLKAKAIVKKNSCGMDEYEVTDNDGIAFDHTEIILSAYATLRNHLESDGLAYELLPEQFTIMQLQKVHEVILDRPLLAANFRRKIISEIEETGIIEEGKAFRPAMLYRYKGL
ncbi:MAG: NUDIX hydrolase [Lachnospiraceae bacterium]|nr:NUDIX hydrolase [Candidatus Colinaster scatohippi]